MTHNVYQVRVQKTAANGKFIENKVFLRPLNDGQSDHMYESGLRTFLTLEGYDVLKVIKNGQTWVGLES